MNHRPGAIVPVTGIYWVQRLQDARQPFPRETGVPKLPNLCGRGKWELVEAPEKERE